MKFLKGLSIIAVAIVACLFGSGHGDVRGLSNLVQRAKSAFSSLTSKASSSAAGVEYASATPAEFNSEMPRLVAPGNNASGTVDLASLDHDDAPAVARAFMEAIKFGDAKAAGELLTFAAKHAMAGEGLVPVAEGAPAAFFHIGATEYGNGNRTAHVECSWTEAGAFSIVLRQEVPGWRVAGLVHQNGQKDVYSFESPKAMIR